MKIKFPVIEGVGDAQTDTLQARKCYVETIKKGQPGEELLTVEPIPGDPGKVTKIGSKMKEDVQDQVVKCLLENKDIFAWTPQDLEGIDPGATYQRLVDKIFQHQLGKNMEVYVDDMLVKSKEAHNHVEDLEETFVVLKKYRLKLNPRNCTFGVSGGRFLGFMVMQQGINANPANIKAILDMGPPTNIKKVQRLTGRIAAFSRFISKSAEKCLAFFKTLGKAVSSVLVREEEGTQTPIYYVSKVPNGAESCYPPIEKMVLALSRGGQTNTSLKQVFGKAETSERLVKLTIELSEYDILYLPRTTIKAQALADFVPK
ncbi:UNVERIFIED_CONTAM: hypothetical protein Slati_0454900 [Sesamum latifolium]|uniref:Reverse transcriptase domain-containing protein n=1 Tax=Sesamum latifolium TaxID=2727402 RepID=A0AAW2XVX8_9LAMI